MRKLTTNAVAMLLALVGCMGCGNRSASSVDNLIRVGRLSGKGIDTSRSYGRGIHCVGNHG